MEYFSYENKYRDKGQKASDEELDEAIRIVGSGLDIGAVGGYLYWRYVGCASGTCPITASPWTSTVWGAAIGGLLMSSFKKEKSYE